MNKNSDSAAITLDVSAVSAITFDCYGTLVDWETGICEALKPVLAAHEIVLDRSELLRIYGVLEPRAQHGEYRPYREVLEEVALGFGKRFSFQPSAREASCLAHSIGDWPVFSDSTEALLKLKRRYKIALVSNNDNDLIKLSSERLGVEFDWIITAQDARAYKPALEVFHHAFEQTGLNATQILHVAQSVFHDIAPANTLGMRSVWVNRRRGLKGSGATPRASARPTLEVGSLAELASILV